MTGSEEPEDPNLLGAVSDLDSVLSSLLLARQTSDVDPYALAIWIGQVRRLRKEIIEENEHV